MQQDTCAQQPIVGLRTLNNRLKKKIERIDVISKLVNKFRKLFVYYKTAGFLEFCRYIAANSFFFQKFAIFEKNISEPFQDVQAKIPVNIRLISRSEEDINRLVEFWPDVFSHPFDTPKTTKEHITNLLTAGEECMIAEYEGEIVHMNWIGFHDSHIFLAYERKRGLRIDESIGYNTYCAEKFRGNSLMNAVHTEIFYLLKRRGYKKRISYVSPNNLSSMKCSTRSWGKPVQMLYCIKILWFNFSFLSKRVR
jgi:hypothetical protein